MPNIIIKRKIKTHVISFSGTLSIVIVVTIPVYTARKRVYRGVPYIIIYRVLCKILYPTVFRMKIQSIKNIFSSHISIITAWSMSSDTHTPLASAAFLLCGGASLVPWQVYISSLDFFMEMLPNRSIQYSIPLTNMSAILVTTIVIIALAQKVRPAVRIVGSGAMLMLALLVIPVQNYYLLINKSMFANGTLASSLQHGGQGESTIFWLVLLSTLLCAVCSSAMQSSLFGMAAAMSSDGTLTVWLTIGQGTAGLGVVALRFVTKAFYGEAKAAISTIAFFVIGFVWVFIGVFVFILMLRQKRLEEERARSLSNVNGPDSEIGKFSSTDYHQMEDGTDHEASISRALIFKKIWRQAFSVCLVFTTCISCFPGLTASFKSTTFGLGSWFPLCLVGTYNTADLIGKTLPNYVSYFSKGNRSQFHLPIAAICHVLMVPAFVLRDVYPVALGDIYAFAIVVILGLTTGYIGCSSMMLGPAQCSNGREREMAGTLDTLFLVGGLSLGSILGMVISIIRQGNHA